jgi:hypothetical protein
LVEAFGAGIFAPLKVLDEFDLAGERTKRILYFLYIRGGGIILELKQHDMAQHRRGGPDLG